MLKLVRNQILSFSIPRNFFRHFTGKKKEAPNKKKATRKKSCEKHSKPSPNFVKITKHLESIGSQSLIKEFSRKYLKILRTPQSLYLADKKIAVKFRQLIEEDIFRRPSTFVAEINPGIGLLTESLLETTIPKLYLYETSPSFVSPTSRLQLLVNANPKRLEVRKYNLLKMWEAAFLDFKDGGNRLHELLEGTEKRKWNEEPYMQIIGAIPNDNFIKQMLMSVIFQNTFVEYGRIVFYLALPPLIWQKLTATKDSYLYKNRSILFQVLFDYQKIGTLPRKSFLPWIVDKSSNKFTSENAVKLEKLSHELLYLVRIEPKADLFDEKMNPDDLLKFFYFIKHHLQKNNTRIIPALEKWIPHCGPRLIAQDLNIYSEFQELSPNELLKLYKDFSSWPEFETSQFLTCMTSFINRIQEAVSNFDVRYRKIE